MRINVARDRAGTFEPTIVPKHAWHPSGFDEAVISLYAQGMTTGDIVAHLEDVYGSSVSKDLVSRVTDAVLEAMQAWQGRPLDSVYPVVLVDCMYVKMREGQVSNRPIYVVMGISVDGERDVLGLWAGPAGAGEGARAWMGMLSELKNPAVNRRERRADRLLRRLEGSARGHYRGLAAGDRAVVRRSSGAQQPALRR